MSLHWFGAADMAAAHQGARVEYLVFVFSAALALPLAYVVNFSGATLAMGRALSAIPGGTGFQSAITPPWQAKMALLVYGVAVLGFIGSWVDYGFWHAVGYLVSLFIISALVSNFLPRSDSAHFKRLIVASMRRRARIFSEQGRDAELEAMTMLLSRAEELEMRRSAGTRSQGAAVGGAPLLSLAESAIREAEEVSQQLGDTASQLQALNDDEAEWVNWYTGLPESHKDQVDAFLEKGVLVTPENFRDVLAASSGGSLGKG